jgi:capping protein (actin filament) muscle Z-line, beta
MEFISALDLTTRLPASEIDTVVSGLVSLRPDLKMFLNSRMDCRLQILADEQTGKLFIASDFNRITQSYRSPWSNVYTPSSDELCNYYFPPEQLRTIEMTFNELLLSYCHLYYEHGVGSAYFSEGVEPGVFFAVIHIKKDYHDETTRESHSWESTHSVKVSTRVSGGLYAPSDNTPVDISITSTVLVVFEFGGVRPCSLNGSISRESTRSFASFGDFDEQLIRHLGELLEENENHLRGTMERVTIPRCTELGIASFGTNDDETNFELSSDSDNDTKVTDFRSRMSFGAMNPLHRQSVRPVPAFQADLIGAIRHRRKDDNEN